MNSISSRSHNTAGFSRELKVVSVYMRATGSKVQIFNCSFHPLEKGGEQSVEQSICRHCTGNCRDKHINAIRDSSHHGNSNIYQCELGLMFWVSPMYCDGKFSGALRGSGYISNTVDGSTFAKKSAELCDGSISPEKFLNRVSGFHYGDAEKIQSLAEILQLCAKSLSSGSCDFHELLKIRTKQQASLSALVDELKIKYPAGSTLPDYPFDKERQLIASIQRGDKKEMEQLLNELLAAVILSNHHNFRYIQIRALELAVLLARAGMNSGNIIPMEFNTRYIKQIQESKTVEELAGLLHSIVENITDQIVSFQGIPHASALRKAEAYIRENLTRKISLSEIAGIAGLSGPYFSTIFKEEMGENLSRYINRLRVERACIMLLETNFSLSDISAACCFEDQSWFSKIFKSFTGTSPGKYRSRGKL